MNTITICTVCTIVGQQPGTHRGFNLFLTGLFVRNLACTRYKRLRGTKDFVNICTAVRWKLIMYREIFCTMILNRVSYYKIHVKYV